VDEFTVPERLLPVQPALGRASKKRASAIHRLATNTRPRELRIVRLEHGHMDENRIAGTAKNFGGKVQEEVGRAAGDPGMEANGIANEVSGTAQDLYGQARDGAANIPASAREQASSLGDTVRNFVESQPYTGRCSGLPAAASSANTSKRLALFVRSRIISRRTADNASVFNREHAGLIAGFADMLRNPESGIAFGRRR
jgi:uncharacterized protein YjbJ (UPF0337 family)